MIDKDLELYYRNASDMFVTEGWKTLMSDLAANANNINSVEHTKDGEDLHFRKGQLSVLGSLLTLETQLKEAEEQALIAEDYEDEAA
jgi:hypothetical protein